MRRSTRRHPPCPLCASGATTPIYTEDHKEYRVCTQCTLIFVPAGMRPTPLDEVLRYQQHRNERGDPRYESFLRRLADPLMQRLPPGARGLDFGAGPTPVLGELLSSHGFPTVSYDPLFLPDEVLLESTYDFIAGSEVIEHLHRPAEVFERFTRLLRPGGVLGVMTRFYGHEAPFADWWYRRDPTHVCFYREETMAWIAQRFEWRLELPVANVAIFTAAAAPDREHCDD